MPRLLRIRAMMTPEDMRQVGDTGPRGRLRGKGLHVEVVGPDSEVLGLLAVSAITIECKGRREPVTATVRCDVSELDLLVQELEREP
jgi:hypothetical protein